MYQFTCEERRDIANLWPGQSALRSADRKFDHHGKPSIQPIACQAGGLARPPHAPNPLAWKAGYRSALATAAQNPRGRLAACMWCGAGVACGTGVWDRNGPRGAGSHHNCRPANGQSPWWGGDLDDTPRAIPDQLECKMQSRERKVLRALGLLLAIGTASAVWPSIWHVHPQIPMNKPPARWFRHARMLLNLDPEVSGV